MLTKKELEYISKLKMTNPDFAYYFNRIAEEEKYTLSKIFHEIRNPVTLINSTIQLLELQEPQVLQIKKWHTLVDDIQSLKSLLDDMSSLNSSECLSKEIISIKELLIELTESFSSLAAQRNINLKLQAGNSKSLLYCDKIKLKQSFTNIIKNAFEAITDDTGIVSISIHNSNDMLCVYIENNGPQIDSEIIEQIFTPFVTYKNCGTGLGLSITKKIIESHGGQLLVTSNPDLTSFQIKLPNT